jgi:hypothetical protein
VLSRIDRAAGGYAVDAGLYALSAAFALITMATATLPPHGAWGRLAVTGYGVAAIVALVALARPALRLPGLRIAAAALALLTTALLPLVVEAVQRADGRTDRAQEEVLVVENGGDRLLHTGTPYLGHDAIAALPPDERLLGYLPYQPGMALFGLPHALVRTAWWTDARVWFALVTLGVLAWAAVLLRRAGVAGGVLLRGGQAVLVVPLGALALAVGGDDLPVLALCLLALAYAALGRDTASGLAIGVAGALKLFAWPVALVLVVLAATRRHGWRTALGAVGVPILVLIPPALVAPDAAAENVLRFPLGLGLVGSPAASNFPGHLIALWLPAGNAVAAALLGLAGAAIGVWLWRRPPRDGGDAALVCAVGLLAATLLMPSTRFGYLLYPLAFAVCVPALRVPATRPAPVPAEVSPAAEVGGGWLHTPAHIPGCQAEPPSGEPPTSRNMRGQA